MRSFRLSPHTPHTAFGFRSPLLAAGAVALLWTLGDAAVPAPVQAKDKWFENPLDRLEKRSEGRRRLEPRNTDGGIARVAFDDPPDAGRLLFGADAERALTLAIRRYEAIVADGGWPKIPQGEPLAPGIAGERVNLLNRRLIASGDQEPAAASSYKYNDAEVEAVTRFQRRQGLKETGRVYRRTLEALNVSAAQRLAQLRVNLDRIRRIAAEVGDERYVLINIPSYELQAVSGGRVDLHSRVITGKPNTPTPVMRTNVRAVNFFPYWNVPASIAQRAIVPKAAKDPGYLIRERIRVYGPNGAEVDPRSVDWARANAASYRFRQDPGPLNALGLVRFDMPNKHTVYMHDTPLQTLFRYGVRAYSAGCIRVNRIEELTAWMLQETGAWSVERIRDALASSEARTVELVREVPVHLVYVTAWGEGDGTASFRLDVYNRDGGGRSVADLEGTAAQISALSP